MNRLPEFAPFDYADKADAGPKWEKWINRLELLFTGMDISDNDRKRALLLHYAGERVYDIYEAEKRDTATDYEATKQVLSTYFSPRKNVQMEIYKFRNCKQSVSQSLDEYVTELRQLAKNCEFTDGDKEILSQIIQNCHSNRLRRRALRETDMTLAKLLDLGRALEASESQAQTMEAHSERSMVSEGVHAVDKRKRDRIVKPTARQRDSKPRENSRETQCRYCGGTYPHTSSCPAKGKTCHFCKKPNHFQKMCKKKRQTKQLSVKKPVHEVNVQVDSQNIDGDDYLYSINCNKSPKQTLQVNGVTCRFLLDTGASVNVLDEATYQKLGKPFLERSDTPRLVPYGGGKRLKVAGSCVMTVEWKNLSQSHKFFVVKGNSGPLLGYPACHSLGLVQIVCQLSHNDLMSKYSDLFHGMGKLKNKSVRIHIDENVKPVAQRARRIPFHLRSKVETELDKLLKDDIIEKVDSEPTPWISPIVCVPKKNPEEIRVCVAMRQANRAIIRFPCESPISKMYCSSLHFRNDIRSHCLNAHSFGLYTVLLLPISVQTPSSGNL